MATLKVLLLATLFISYCSGQNAPCTPIVKNELFIDFMKSMNCAVDKNLLSLFANDEVFNKSIVKNPTANFMCIGLMDALARVPETLCDANDPLSDIQKGDFCSGSKIAALRKISGSNIFDEKSNFFTVSKFTEEKCEKVCNDDTNQLCWAFGIIAGAVLKYTQSTQSPTTVPTTAAPQSSTMPDLPPLISQGSDSPGSDSGNINTDGDKGEDKGPTDKPEDNSPTDGGDVNTDDAGDDKEEDKGPTDKPEDNSPTDGGDVNTDDAGDDKEEDKGPTDKPEDNIHTDNAPSDDGGADDDDDDKGEDDKSEDTDKTPTITTTTSDGNVTKYFNKNEGNNSESMIENPNTKVEIGKDSDEDNKEYKEIEDDDNEVPTNIVTPGNDDIDNNRSHPLEVGGSDGNQIVNNTTEDQSQPDGTEIGNDTTDTHAEDGTEDNDDTQDTTGQDLNSSQDIAGHGDDDSTVENPDQGRVNFDDTSNDDDGYSYWHFAAILLFILFLGVAGYLASLNRKKVSITVVLYVCDI